MDLARIVEQRFPETDTAYGFKETILYALGTGFGAEPLDPGHLKFVYEDGLAAVPTMANVLGHPGFWVREPRFAIDWKKLLHAEQRLTLHQALAPEGRLIGRHRILGVRDRGPANGAMVYQEKTLTNAASGDPVATLVTTLMLRGDGGSGDFGEAPAELEKLADVPPERIAEAQTLEIAPLIYRLSGDLNPLHIDPAVATQAGFERPILHGLATKGFACYALLKTYCGFDPGRLRAMAVRFSRPVLPGDLIRFEFWQPKPGLVRFRASVPARRIVVLDRCSAEILG